MIFNTVLGTIAFGSRVLKGGATPSDVITQGFVFEREFDMKTGWVFRNTRKDALDGHPVAPALGFNANKLKRVSLTFLDEEAATSTAMAERHRQFLYRELGTPTRESAAHALYDFAWGQIAAEEDPRNGVSHIIVTWN